MILTSGKVKDGMVEVDLGKSIPEGSIIAVMARDGEESFAVDARVETRLLAALKEADAGNVIDADEMLRRIRVALR